MEALTALSVASSVIQFVDFGSKLLAGTRQLYRSADGVLTENVDVECLTLDLLTLSQGMKRKLPENRPLNVGGLLEEDKALDHLCGRCVEIAEELITRLEKLKFKEKNINRKVNEKNYMATSLTVRNTTNSIEGGPEGNAESFQTPIPSQPKTISQYHRTKAFINPNSSDTAEGPKPMQFRKWASFRKALEASWNRKEIEELAETLGNFKSQIEFRILVSFRGTLRDMAIQQSETSKQLAQSTRLILDTFINNRESLANQLRLQADVIVKIKERQEWLEAKGSQNIENFLKGGLSPIGMLQTSRDSYEAKEDRSAKALEVEEQIRLLMIEEHILDSLSFSTLTDRRESVEIAYNQTFEWIYADSFAPKIRWSNFTNWLHHGRGIYWINGKAGSGKSTLMRYLFENKKTKEVLCEWAGSIPVEIVGFFFWNSGELEQRSQRGLLRSLLFEILRRHRDIIPDVMPDIWQEWSARATSLLSTQTQLKSPPPPPELKEWKLVQLRQIFRAVVSRLRNQVKLCLFIDGLDEYEGDYEEIVELFQEYADSLDVKLCLSSRPLMVFERAFVDLPSLKLQNLTHGDISHYVKNKLHGHRYMAQLSKQHAKHVSLLIDEIVEKASGVFLWVKLVVKSLLHGLRDYNRVSDLQKRVRQLPPDLEALYAHMLKDMELIYQEQASQIFQIVRAAKKRSSDKVTLLNLSLAEDEDITLAETAPLKPFTREEISMRCLTMDARLKSVCVGLLESNDVHLSDIAPDSKVMFLHRTVSDFFMKAEVWENVLLHTAGTDFSPNLSMLRSCVLQLKGLEAIPDLPLDMSIISNALDYAKGAEIDLNCGFPKLLDQLDVAASYQWRMRKFNIIFEKSTTTTSMSSSIESITSIHSEFDVDTTMITEDVGFRSSKVDSEDNSKYKAVSHYMDYTNDWERTTSKMEPFASQGISKATPRGFQKMLFYEGNGLDHTPTAKPFFNLPLSSKTEPKMVGSNNTFRPLQGNSSSPHAISIPRHTRESAAVQNSNTHWSCAIEIPGVKPIGKASTFYNIAGDIGLSHYVAMKYKSAIIVDQDVAQYMLTNTITSTPIGTIPDFDTIQMLLQSGASANFSYYGATPWEDALAASVSHFTLPQNDEHWKQGCDVWAQVLEVFIQHDANPTVFCGRNMHLPGHPRLSPILIVDRYFPDFLSQQATRLKGQLELKSQKSRPTKTIEAPLNENGPTPCSSDARDIPIEINRTEDNSWKLSSWVLSWIGK